VGNRRVSSFRRSKEAVLGEWRTWWAIHRFIFLFPHSKPLGRRHPFPLCTVYCAFKTSSVFTFAAGHKLQVIEGQGLGDQASKIQYSGLFDWTDCFVYLRKPGTEMTQGRVSATPKGRVHREG
jgi:hypothetical protein